MTITHFPSKRTFKIKNELPITTTNKASPQKIYGFHIKQLSLIVLVIQNSLLVLMMRYSRTIKDEPIYIASTAVFLAEIIKIFFCCSMLYKQQKSFRTCLEMMQLEIIHRPAQLVNMLIPSGLYAIQNNLLYIALSNLEAATFQVTYQLKILSTAIFSVWLLNTRLTKRQWLALVLLMLGVTLVQMESVTSNTDTSDNNTHQRPWIGLMAVLASCVSSGFAGCYFEKILKTTRTSMWIRNIQLAVCGSFFSFLAMLFSDYNQIRSNGFFQGYNVLTWFVVINQALGGLLVCLVVKYADNILKGFATSISIILSGMISFYLLDFQPSFLFVSGTGIVITATFLYNAL